MNILKKIALCILVAGVFNPVYNLSASTYIKKEKDKKEDAKKDDEKSKDGLENYTELLKEKSFSLKGLFTVHKVENDWYFEIPLNLIDKDFLVVNKMSKIPEKLNDAGFNKGINYRNIVFRWELDREYKKVFAREYKPLVESNPEDAIHASVKDNFITNVFEDFDLKAFNKDSSAFVVKVNKIFDGSNQSFMNAFGASNLGISPITGKSRIEGMKSFEKNIVVKSELTAKIPGAEEHAYLTMGVTCNIVLLPEEPMVPRFADNRVGYFTEDRWYFSDRQQKVEKRKLITRWRLEPKEEDLQKYLNGELVEPKKPIVFYVDPSTPRQWQSYIKQGVEDWQVAFERAGFKNAIQAKYVSEDDKDFDLDDIRYSAVTYAASHKANAMGPSVVDPRSGEILEADIIWWHNVMTSLNRWIRIQTGIVDKNARGNVFPEELMGSAIRFVSSHEVGHTLGLMHNMGASYQYSIDSLRSDEFTASHGTAPSIMDYARFNYLAQPEDGVKKLTPRIGEYDKYAIEFGYRYYGSKDAHEDLGKTKKFLKNHQNDPVYFYGAQQEARNAVDPRSQSEDIGNDAVLASKLGIKNLKKIVPQILDWAGEDQVNYNEAGKLLYGVMEQWHLYSYHVLTNVGGMYLNPTVYGDNKKSFTYVPKAKQKEAVKFLIDEVFNYPEWLFSGDIYNYIYPSKMGPDGIHEYTPTVMLKNYQSYILWDMLGTERLSRMLENESVNGKNAYTVLGMMEDLHTAIFEKTEKNEPLTLADRALQKGFIDALIIASDRNAASKEKKSLQQEHHVCGASEAYLCSHAMHNEDIAYRNASREIKFIHLKRVSDIISMKRGELMRIQKLLEKKSKIKDKATKYHYEDMILRINDALER